MFLHYLQMLLTKLEMVPECLCRFPAQTVLMLRYYCQWCCADQEDFSAVLFSTVGFITPTSQPVTNGLENGFEEPASVMS